MCVNAKYFRDRMYHNQCRQVLLAERDCIVFVAIYLTRWHRYDLGAKERVVVIIPSFCVKSRNNGLRHRLKTLLLIVHVII